MYSQNERQNRIHNPNGEFKRVEDGRANANRKKTQTQTQEKEK